MKLIHYTWIFGGGGGGVMAYAQCLRDSIIFRCNLFPNRRSVTHSFPEQLTGCTGDNFWRLITMLTSSSIVIKSRMDMLQLSLLSFKFEAPCNYLSWVWDLPHRGSALWICDGYPVVWVTISGPNRRMFNSQLFMLCGLGQLYKKMVNQNDPYSRNMCETGFFVGQLSRDL